MDYYHPFHSASTEENVGPIYCSIREELHRGENRRLENNRRVLFPQQGEI